MNPDTLKALTHRFGELGLASEITRGILLDRPDVLRGETMVIVRDCTFPPADNPFEPEPKQVLFVRQ